jgi:tetraacyldisaccharide 4'-kinase
MHINLNKRGLINYLLLPVAGIFYILAGIRKKLYIFGIFKSYKAKVPVIIVGNITVGGTGKTPVVVEVVKFLQQQGKKVGVISRGYGRQNKDLIIVGDDTNVLDCGDEPKLIHLKTKCLLAVSSNKIQAVKALENKVDVIISDDGLQHYALQRDIEIIVFNGLSNGFYLPAGGLRESKSRLRTADIIIQDNDRKIKPICFVNAKTGESKPLDYFTGKKVRAICAIANPERFFNTLGDLNIDFEKKVFADHYIFSPDDLNYAMEIITTAKDWVKYSKFATKNMWYLDIELEIKPDFYAKLLKLC